MSASEKSPPPEQRYDLLVEQVIDYAIFLLTPAGMVATWNPGAERIKGFTREEIVGRPYETFFTEEDRRAGKPERILAHARSQGRYQEDGWRVRRDGTRFWASVVITALRDQRGELTGFAKITRDLTERLEAEETARRLAAEAAARRQAELDEGAVRRSRDQLDLILRTINEGVTVQAPDGTLVFANDTAAQLTGFATAAELIAAPPSSIIERYDVRREDGTPLSVAELPGRRALRGAPAQAVLRFRRRPEGEERWAIVAATPIFNREGQVELVVNVFHDVTERRRTEHAWRFLAQASATLGTSLDIDVTLAQMARLAVPQIADGCTIEVIGPGGELQQLEVANVDPARAEAARQWRLRPDLGPGPVTLRVLETAKPQLIAEITPQMVAAASADPDYQRFITDQGLRSAMVVPLIVGNKPFGIISFTMSSSGRRYREYDLILAMEVARRASLAMENARAYREVRTAVQARDNFLSIASHELRTPLSALSITMTSLVRVAERGKLMQLGEQGLKDRFVKLDRQVTQLSQLVDRLLDVNRLSSGEARLELAPTDLGEVARDVVARFEDLAASAGGWLRLHLEGEVVGRWDRTRLDQVITNLVSNAVRYAGRSPITVTVGPGGPGQARLVVADRGPGIPREDHERIFNQFERGDTGNTGGMGLGLWLVRRIVAAHGGTITLESERGRGATFTVLLPTDREQGGQT